MKRRTRCLPGGLRSSVTREEGGHRGLLPPRRLRLGRKDVLFLIIPIMHLGVRCWETAILLALVASVTVDSHPVEMCIFYYGGDGSSDDKETQDEVGVAGGKGVRPGGPDISGEVDESCFGRGNYRGRIRPTRWVSKQEGQQARGTASKRDSKQEGQQARGTASKRDSKQEGQQALLPRASFGEMHQLCSVAALYQTRCRSR
ncbi:unnamed protein product [Darwinula stevensoni]|uniref:Uncharacterized protein n=1 Tax=Darwinula stevensoni TaxID=69355 RepID=A0A7R9ACQ8_9CRUS|nr:unnamed protein product [Darwinula stevensoni]CAG0900616.1 unnamed protein product [Darwinula stevensoni]